MRRKDDRRKKLAWLLATLGPLLSANVGSAAPSVCALSADCFDSALGRWYKSNTHAHAGMLLHGSVPHGSRDILKAHVERTRAAGGITIVNHPNYHGAIKPGDMLGLEGVHLFEVFNGEVEAHNDAGAGRLSTEQLWDTLLTAGMRVYGIAADDAHYFKLPDVTTHYRGTFTLPGSG